jgi:hypothetical protein
LTRCRPYRAAVAAIALAAVSSVHAINAQYAKQLERSGCTQVSELQGCDIRKTRAENAKAGFASDAPPSGAAPSSPTPYAGKWFAKNADGTTLSTIRVDHRERAWVNGKRAKARRGDGALIVRDGAVTYVIQGDRRLKGEDYWSDSSLKTKGRIDAE